MNNIYLLVKIDENGRQKYIELNKEAQEYFPNLPIGEIKSDSKENDSEKKWATYSIQI